MSESVHTPAFNRSLEATFAVTLFLSAGLLFSVQPMIGRMVLPLLGGSPSVWTTCLLFFQSVLLAGYLLADQITRRFGLVFQELLVAVLWVAAFLVVPIGLDTATATRVAEARSPTLVLFLTLARVAGLPVLVISVTAPLLQRWFSYTSHPSATDPYRLYAASNLGSLVALVAYPLLLERILGLSRQAEIWVYGLVGLGLLLGVCGVMAARSGRRAASVEEPYRVNPRDGALWLALAFVPSSLLLGVTGYVTSDLAPIPMLWVVPLALYLTSFILAFSPRCEWLVDLASNVFPLVLMPLGVVIGVGLVQPYWVPLHLLAFFLAALICHGELARRRPPPRGLTSFYLALAVGGVLGGLFNAIVAPRVFNRISEYPLALVGAALILAFRIGPRGNKIDLRRELLPPLLVALCATALCANGGSFADTPLGMLAIILAAGLTIRVATTYRRSPYRFAMTVGALLFASTFATGVGGRVLGRTRSFFGVLTVTDVPSRHKHRLFHGSTVHSEQSTDPARRREPLAYHSREGPVGDLFRAFESDPRRSRGEIAIIGVGAGALTAYATESQHWTLYEIDPEVVRIARDPRYFTYLDDTKARALDVIVGDGRFELARAREGQFSMIVFDAFSSHAIPMHLITREALAIACGKLADRGLIAFNISNRYIDLGQVLAVLAADAGLVLRVRVDALSTREEVVADRLGSIWAVLARNENDLGPLADDPHWSTVHTNVRMQLWTDDHASFLDVLRFGKPVAPSSP